MLHRSYFPPPPLAEFVDQLWYLEGFSAGSAKERALPDGTVELVINLSEDEIRSFGAKDATECRRHPGAVLIGPHSEHFVIDGSQTHAVIGVHFKPGGAYPFFRAPPGELKNEHLALDDVWGTFGRTLRERLLEAACASSALAGHAPVEPELRASGIQHRSAAQTDLLVELNRRASLLDARFRVLESALLSQVRRGGLTRHPAVSFALKDFDHTDSVAALTSRVGLSAKRFADVFTREVGLTPKMYSRLQRFQRVLRLLQEPRRPEAGQVATRAGGVHLSAAAAPRAAAPPHSPWSAIALECGYYDQAHLIHEFREFAGITPTAYAAQTRRHPNHVPVAD